MHMADRGGIFVGDDPFVIAQRWLDDAAKTESNDPNAIALATVDSDGLPNVRMVLLKEITHDAFVFYTNYEGTKGQEIEASGKAAFVLHSKTQARQVRVRGMVEREDPVVSDVYYASRSLQSRLGAWASAQSRPLASRGRLMAEVAKVTAQQGTHPARPSHWGGYRITPLEVEFWADGAYRLHDRFRWTRETPQKQWEIQRLNP
jgi:pyridoxamine 5'-phosphate oxidase